MNESRICIALDFKTKSDVENFLKQFEGESLYVKVVNKIEKTLEKNN